MKMSAEAEGVPFEDPRKKSKPKPQKTNKGPSNEMDAMAMDTKGFEAFLKKSEAEQQEQMNKKN